MSFTFTSLIDCNSCESVFEHDWVFPDRVESAQDITEDDCLPQQMVCPECGFTKTAIFEGWTSHDDAG